MRALVCLFLLLTFPLSAFALRLTCVTEYPTTSVVGEEEGDMFTVHVFHHNGMKYMPISTGMNTPNDIPYLQEKAESFAKIGDHYVFQWKLEKCKRVDQELMYCSGGEETEIEGVKVRPWSLWTKRIKSEFDLGSFSQIEVSFNLAIESKDWHFSMIYQDTECSQEKRGLDLFKTLNFRWGAKKFP